MVWRNPTALKAVPASPIGLPRFSALLAFCDDFYRAGALLPEDDSLRILMLEG